MRRLYCEIRSSWSCLVDIPKDIQFAEGEYENLSKTTHKTYTPPSKIDMAVSAVVDLMRPRTNYIPGGV